MAKCKNDAFMAKIGQKKVTNRTEVDFDVLRFLPDCNQINAKNYISEVAGTDYNAWKIPKDQFECYRQGCVNSGTLYGFETSELVYRFYEDATEYASGVITFYVIKGAATAVEVSVSDTSAFTNANKYTISNLNTMTPGDDGFIALAVDLSQTPTTTEGTGWTPSESGAYIRFKFTGANAETGISSIAIYEEMEDFATSSVVKVACLSSMDGDFGLDVAEASCFNPGRYSTENITFERTVNGAAVTPNYMLLNPLAKRNDRTTDFDMVTVEKTIDQYGKVMLYDVDADECGRIGVQLAAPCIASDSMLTRLTIPTQVVLGEKQFVVLAADVNEPSTVALVFNEIHNGSSVIITYPKKVNVESYDLAEDNLDGVITRMTYARQYTDGTKWRFVFDHVLVTSFPDSISNEDDAEFAFTISIQKGPDGKFGRAYRILDGVASGGGGR